MKRILLLLSLLSIINCEHASFDVPLDGKFFYVQMHYNDDIGYYLNAEIGQNKTKQKWTTTTGERAIGIISKICIDPNRGCKKSNSSGLYDSDGEDGDRNWIKGSTYFEPSTFPDDTELQRVILQGQEMYNSFNLTLGEYKRETLIDEMTSYVIFQSNNQVNKDTQLDLNNGVTGYMGLQPYTSSLVDARLSFLYELKYKLKLLDNIVVSFYLQKDGLSMIKFGSWDKNALSDVSKLKIFQTPAIDGWVLRAKKATMKDKTLFDFPGNNAYDFTPFKIDPYLQYTYIPEDQYNSMAQYAQQVFGKEIDCNSRNCKFDTACNAVSNKEFSFSVTITDNTGLKETYLAKQEDMLVNGQYLTGLASDNDKCYLGVFKSVVDKKTWHVGHNFMVDKYYFFDMGPYDNNQIAFLQIGIGPLRKTNIIGKTHYDAAYNDYMPEAKANDMSKQISGEDPYDSQQYERGHERRKLFNSPIQQTWLQENKALFGVLMVLLFFVLTSIIVLTIYCVRKRREAKEERDMIARGSIAHPDDFADNDRQDDSDHLDRSGGDRSAINQSENTDFEESKKIGGKKQNFEKYYDYEQKKQQSQKLI